MSEDLVRLLRDCYPDEGLYIQLESGELISLSATDVYKTSDEYWNESTLLSDEIKQDFIFQRCGGCPSQDKALCDGIRPAMTILDKVRSHDSFEPVIAVYHEDDEYIVKHTTLQHALEYVAHMMITKFCFLSKEFAHYYEGVKPLMSHQEIGEKVLINILKDFDHNIEITRMKARQLEAIIDLTSRSRAKRIGKLTDGDALLNANANMALPNKFLEILVARDEFIDEEEDQSGWKNVYTLGAPEIDGEHKRIIEYLTITLDEYRSSGEQSFPRAILTELIGHTKLHFKHEEEYFLHEFGSHLSDEHIQAHMNLIERFDTLLDSEQTDYNIEILEVTKLWILEHILVYDKGMALDVEGAAE